MFKKLDPGAQFQWERISSAVQPRRSLRGSEAEPTTSSRYSSFRGRERSLDPRRLRRAFRTHGQTGLRPKAYIDLQPLGLTCGEEKSDSPFVSTLHPPSRIGPSMQVFQRASGSPDQAYLNPIACTLDTDLLTDHRPCTSPEQSGEGSLKRQPTCLRQRKYSQSVKDQGEDVHGARLRLAL